MIASVVSSGTPTLTPNSEPAAAKVPVQVPRSWPVVSTALIAFTVSKTRAPTSFAAEARASRRFFVAAYSRLLREMAASLSARSNRYTPSSTAKVRITAPRVAESAVTRLRRLVCCRYEVCRNRSDSVLARARLTTGDLPTSTVHSPDATRRPERTSRLTIAGWSASRTLTRTVGRSSTDSRRLMAPVSRSSTASNRLVLPEALRPYNNTTSWSRLMICSVRRKARKLSTLSVFSRTGYLRYQRAEALSDSLR